MKVGLMGLILCSPLHQDFVSSGFSYIADSHLLIKSMKRLNQRHKQKRLLTAVSDCWDLHCWDWV